MKTFHSNGKILLSAEYVVLDGATALALPTKFGQDLKAEPIEEARIEWKSLDEKGEIWLKCIFKISETGIEIDKSNPGEAFQEVTSEERKLLEILNVAQSLNPKILNPKNGFRITTALNFPKKWGLGTSSTLINNIAQWLEIDPFALLEKTFGGSGYDIAAAKNNTPITFVRSAAGRSALKTSFNPEFQDSLFFVHLNRKQNSRESIQHYKNSKKEALASSIEKITSITHKMITCNNLEEFELLMEIHETIISKLIGLPKVKTQYFPDFPGSIKSLGGWGGDFILATGKEPEKEYFRKKGFTTLLDFEEMVL